MRLIASRNKKLVVLVILLFLISILIINQFIEFDHYKLVHQNQGLEIIKDEAAAAVTLDLPPPLIIGAGQGTTGTHTAHLASCRLGIPSSHFQDGCHFYRMNGPIFNTTLYDAYDRGKPYYVPTTDRMSFPKDRSYGLPSDKSTLPIKEFKDFKSKREWLKKHPAYKVSIPVKKIFKCMNPKSENCPPEEAKDMASWALMMKGLIDDAVRWYSDDTSRNIAAVHDCFWTDSLPYLIDSAKRHRNQEPIIVLTERNPEEWVRRRTSHQFPLCRIDLIDGPHYIDNNKTSNKIVLPPITSHFDWLECIERTVRAKEQILRARRLNKKSVEKKVNGSKTTKKQDRKEKKKRRETIKTENQKPNKQRNKTKHDDGSEEETVTVNLYEVFISYSNVRKAFDGLWSVKADLKAHIAAAFERHQDSLKHRADIRFNMFEETVTSDDIAAKIHEAFSRFTEQPRIVVSSVAS